MDERRSQTKASRFEIYLRTGLLLSDDTLDDVQVKFNPWHDPNDGRFTFSGRGAFIPGGGSFGGGGASGRWDPPTSTQKKDKSPRQPGLPLLVSEQATSPAKAARILKPAKPPTKPKRPKERFAHERRNGYDFEIDAHKRTRRVEGEIHLDRAESRSRSVQAAAGKPDRRSTDDGGHYVAARFGGPREWFNHSAQDANLNRGTYNTMEKSWEADVRAGHRVFVDIVPHYNGKSQRPHALEINWYVDGERHSQTIPNEPKGKRDGR